MRRLLALLLILVAGCASPASEKATSAGWDADGARLPQAGEGPSPAEAIPLHPDDAAGLADLLLCGPCDITLTSGIYTWEPSGALDPTDSDHYVVAFRGSAPSIEVHVTFDAGRNWTRSLIPLDADGASAAWTNTGDAVVFFAPDGTLYVGGLGTSYEPDFAPGMDRRTGGDIFIAKSTDGGRSFERPVVVAAGGGAYYTHGAFTYGDSYRNQDRPWFAAGPDGRLVAAWNELGHAGPYPVVAGTRPVQYDGNVFQVATSMDGGATWSDPQTITHGGWPGALVRADGSFVVAHSSHQNGMLSIGRSADGTSWRWEEMGPLLGQPILREYGPQLLLAGTSWWQDGRAASYWREENGSWQGPFIFSASQAHDPFTNLAVHDGALWFSWYGAGMYHVAVADDASSPWPTTRWTVDAGFEADSRLYGDYVDTLGAGNRIYTSWGAQRDGERPIHVAVHWLR